MSKYTQDGLPIVEPEVANRCTKDIFEQKFIHLEMEKMLRENESLAIVFAGLEDYITFCSRKNPSARQDIEFGAALIYRLLREQSAENQKYGRKI